MQIWDRGVLGPGFIDYYSISKAYIFGDYLDVSLRLNKQVNYELLTGSAKRTL